MKTMSILGINMSCLSYREMHPIFEAWLADRNSRAHALAVINVHICVSSLFDRRLRRLYNSADLAGIDSMPFLMWARLFYQRDSDRFYAPDLMLELSRVAAEKGHSFYLYGGFPGAPDKIEAYLADRYPDLRIVGKFSPPFRELTVEEDRDVVARINEARPDFVWIGLGSPKQDVWIRDHLEALRGCIIIPAGATFDFFSGRIRQAPRWIRSSGFEWLFRLTQDFSRLWQRYTVYNLVFLIAFTLQQLRILTFDAQSNMMIFGRRTRLGNA